MGRVVWIVWAVLLVAAFGGCALVSSPFFGASMFAAVAIGSAFLPGVVRGKDGLLSTSKFQMLLWTATFAFVWVAY